MTADAFPRWRLHGLGSPWNLREVADGLFVGSVADVAHPEWSDGTAPYVVDMTDEGDAGRTLFRVLADARREGPSPTLDGHPAAREVAMGTYHVPTPDGAPMTPATLERAVRRILRWRVMGRPVLVHCYAGANRSAAVAYAALRLLGVEADEALRRVSTPSGPHPWAMQGVEAWALAQSARSGRG